MKWDGIDRKKELRRGGSVVVKLTSRHRIRQAVVGNLKFVGGEFSTFCQLAPDMQLIDRTAIVERRRNLMYESRSMIWVQWRSGERTGNGCTLGTFWGLRLVLPERMGGGEIRGKGDAH